MRFVIALWRIGIIGTALLFSSMGFADQFSSSKIDTNIKPLVFPQSLVIIQYCGYKTEPFCFDIEPMSEAPIEKEVLGLGFSEISQALSNQKSVKQVLKKIDPARIVPVKIAEPVHKFIMYDLQRSIAKQYEADIVLAIKSALKLSKNTNDGNPAIKVKGVIYLDHQQVIIGHPSGEQELSLQVPDMEKQIKEAFKMSLMKLAKEARKIIMSHKYEKRRSNY